MYIIEHVTTFEDTLFTPQIDPTKIQKTTDRIICELETKIVEDEQEREIAHVRMQLESLGVKVLS